MYSFHSSPEEKNKLLFALAQHGIETTVDRVAKKKRIRDWIQESIIQEDDEEEQADDNTTTPSSIVHRKPIAGHVSSVRAEERAAARKQITTTIKDASNKHINPRTGEIEQGPSEMGPIIINSQPDSTQDRQTNQNGYSNTRNNYQFPTANRNTKLVDVGSQTTNESQRQYEIINKNSLTTDRTNSNENIFPNVPIITHMSALPLSNTNGQYTQTNLNRTNSTSRGLMAAFNSLATVSVPESQQVQPLLQPPTSSQLAGTQSKQTYKQRHNTTALTKQHISRSANNSINNLINDSGYGSLDKLKSMDGNTIISSPLLSKRSIVQSSFVTNSAQNEQMNNIQINGRSHQQKESNSPFHSDSGGDGSPRGSNGFVNLAGVTASTPLIVTSMKDTAYDRVKIRRNKKM